MNLVIIGTDDNPARNEMPIAEDSLNYSAHRGIFNPIAENHGKDQKLHMYGMEVLNVWN